MSKVLTVQTVLKLRILKAWQNKRWPIGEKNQWSQIEL